jgi:DNA phosphorothioation-associated putative methyltransferase
MLQDGLLTSGETFFDYGCGFGDDIKNLSEQGFRCSGWDPAFCPECPRTPSDVVNLGYVVNVIEDAGERRSTLQAAWALSRKLLIVSARLKNEADPLLTNSFADGVVTRWNTFQKYFDHSELQAWIEESLQTDAYSAAPGIFYVFRESANAESFAERRQRRRVYVEIFPPKQFSTRTARSSSRFSPSYRSAGECHPRRRLPSPRNYLSVSVP